MSDDFYKQLNQIITLSEQILLWLSNEIEDQDKDTDTLDTEKLMQWNTERDRLIKLTFNESQTKYYSKHLPLINRMMELDQALNLEASNNKDALQAGLLKMKKNQKAANTYKKY